MNFDTFVTAFKFARRELRAGLSGFRILVACLALGVAAIAAVGSVRSGIEAGIKDQGAVLLGGDAEAEFAYRFANNEELEWLHSVSTSVSVIVDFRSMAVIERNGNTERALTQIKAIDNVYPLTGNVTLASGNSLKDALMGSNSAVMERILADRLELRTGDTFRLGTKEFKLTDIILSIPDGAGSGFGLGPRTIVKTQTLDGSGLLQAGSLFSTKYRITVPQGTDLDLLEQKAETRFEQSGVRWRDARNGAPGVSAFVERLGSFLILVGLAGLAVGGVGVSLAVRSYLVRKISVIASLRSLGATNALIFMTYFIQIGIFSLIGILIGVILGVLAPVIFEPMIAAALPFPIEVRIFFRPIAEAIIYGILTATIFTLWPLAQAENIKAAALFRDTTFGRTRAPRLLYWILTIGLLALLLFCAVQFTGSVWITLWTAFGVLAALGTLSAAAIGLRGLARWAVKHLTNAPKTRWALSAMGGTQEGAAAVVLAIGLGLSVLASIGQIDGNLRAAIKNDLPDIAPSYFFVDIQKNQIAKFRDILNSDSGVKGFDEAPMLRGIITRINDIPATEVAGNHWVIRGDRGITYANEMPKRTTLVAGEWWPKDYKGSPQVSVAAEEAAEIGLSLGDSITVNIMGRDITAQITSFRDVDFSTAGIGFVMLFNANAVENAPHTFISTVYANETAETRILRTLAKEFPNITAIRIKDAIERVSDVLNSIAAATSYGASAALLTGFLVLIGSAAAGQHARNYEAAILKTLGATRADLMMSFALRFALIGAAAGSVAIFAGITGGWAVSNFVMDTEFHVVWPIAIAIVLGGVFANLCAGLVFAIRSLNIAPARVLRSRE